MNWLSKAIRRLKGRLFGIEQTEPKTETAKHTTKVIEDEGPIVGIYTSLERKRDPYFIQIGLDFGTSYSKCVCRDVITNKAWVHLHPRSQNEELPFLIPSALMIKNNEICHVEDGTINYPEGGVYHLKNALSLVARGDLNDSLLTVYKKAVRLKKPNQFPGLIATCTIYFLAGVLGEIRDQIRKRFPGFGSMSEDYMAVNLAIPVGDAQQDKIRKVFQAVLNESWELSDELAGHPRIHLNELISLRRKLMANRPRSFGEACFVYPEVSANVQGFVRSRVSSPGVYLFNDTGGGTVDQSIFIFSREGYSELAYLAGRVLQFGSSRIEEKAATKSGKNDQISLEEWRKKKERGEKHFELEEAKDWIFDILRRETERTLALAKRKLYVKEQLNDIKIIFGGGGDCEYPYRKAVVGPFSGQLFRKPIRPEVIGMPVPKDLSLKGAETRWMNRLSVAYGLSFDKNELVPFMFPNNLSDPKPEEIWQPEKRRMDAPTKDEC